MDAFQKSIGIVGVIHYLIFMNDMNEMITIRPLVLINGMDFIFIFVNIKELLRQVFYPYLYNILTFFHMFIIIRSSMIS